MATTEMRGAEPRPRVTLSWAQAIDGSLSAAAGQRTLLSGPESLRMTHGLRGRHEGLLVGIGTILVDDPSLTLRLAPGLPPRPLVLDSRLRCPPGARFLAGGGPQPWIVTAPSPDPGRRARLESAGARILEAPLGPRGGLELSKLLLLLREEGLASLMVEGGASVIAAFLASRLVDEIVVTLCPSFLGGPSPYDPAHAAQPGSEPGTAPGPAVQLEGLRIEVLGRDVVLSGRPLWGEPED